MKNYFFHSLPILCLLFSLALAQHENEYDDELFEQNKTEGGLVFSMAESGSGVGMFFSLPFASKFHAGLSLDAFFLRDSKQIEYADPYYGGYYQINKINNVYIFDLQITLKRRLFAEDLDDSFRPFISGGFGPVFGMNFPEDESLKDQYEWSFGGFVGGGADVTFDKRYFIGLRGQYRIIPFSRKLGETKNQSMFELRMEIGRRF
jgi:hypothetical protein